MAWSRLSFIFFFSSRAEYDFITNACFSIWHCQLLRKLMRNEFSLAANVTVGKVKLSMTFPCSIYLPFIKWALNKSKNNYVFIFHMLPCEFSYGLQNSIDFIFFFLFFFGCFVYLKKNVFQINIQTITQSCISFSL